MYNLFKDYLNKLDAKNSYLKELVPMKKQRFNYLFGWVLLIML